MTSGALEELQGDASTDRRIRAQQSHVRAAPRVVSGYIDLARLFVEKARESEDPRFYRRAQDAVDRALEIDGQSTDAAQLQCLLELQEHRFREARDAARSLETRERAERGVPRPETMGLLSDALLELGDYEGATDAAQRMVDQRPSSQSYVRAAWLRWMHGDPSGAIEVMRLAIDAAGRSPETRAWIETQMGVLYWNTGDLERAQRFYTSALADLSTFSAAHSGLARIALARGDAATAVTEARAALHSNASAENEWLMGDALTAAGSTSEGESHYATLERIGPRTDPRTLSLYLSTTNQRAGDALQLARAEHENRQDVFTDDVLAWALFRANQLDSAAEAIARAQRIGTRDARILYHLGMIRRARGDRAGAIEALRSALGANPYWSRAEAGEARRVLAEMGGDGGGA